MAGGKLEAKVVASLATPAAKAITSCFTVK